MNTHDHYRAGERIRSNISTYDGYHGGGEKFTNVGDLGTVTSRTEDGTYEVQMDTGRTKVFTKHQISPAGPDPEATAQELALTVQRAAPGADVYTSTTTKEVS